MANISAIKLPSGTTYTIVDNTSGYTKNTGTVTSVAASGSGGISISGSPVTTSGTIAIGLNLSTAINGLGEGTSPAQRADYIVAQYAGGGTTTTTYHRRSLANIFAALNASDITTALGYTPYNATNPNGYTTNTGTVTSVGTGAGLTGGSITTSGTIKANLTSDTALSNAALSVTEDANRIYPVRIDKNSKLVVVVPWTNVNSSYLTSSSTLNAANLSGAIPSAVTATTQASTDNSTKIATTAYVTTAIANLPEPMIFKGSVGTGGTITSLPTAAAANEGWTYKVITALSSPAAKVGDTVISNGSSWVVIPSGDEPSGTVTSVAAGTGLNTTSNDTTTDGGTITSSGTIYLTKSGVTAGSYGDSAAQTPGYGSTFKVPYITVDKYGRVTGISEHTVKIPASDNTNTTYTLTNALASHKFTWTLTPSSGSATTTTAEFVQGTGITLTDDTTNKKITIANSGVRSISTGSANGTISVNTNGSTADVAVKGLGSNAYTSTAYLPLTGGTVTGPTIFENSVTIDEATTGDLVVTGAATFTNYPTSITTSTGTNQLTLASNSKYVLTTPGGSFIFTTPIDNNTTYSAGNGLRLSGTQFINTRIPFVAGTQSAATGAWTGICNDVAALYDGLTIAYWLPYAGSGNATLNLTINGTATGAKNCYYSGTTRLTTHFGAGNIIYLTYRTAANVNGTTYEGWWANANYDSNDTGYYHRRIYPNMKAGAVGIFPYTLIMQRADGRWESIVTSSSTGTSKARNTNGFLLGHVLLMYYNETYTENQTVSTYRIWSAHTGLIDHRYSFNTANDSTNGTTGYKPIYLVGTIGNDGLFYLDSTKWWSQTLPSTADGKVYIYIGEAYDYYRMILTEDKPMYMYLNGAVREYSEAAGFASVAASASGVAWTNVSSKPTATGSKVTGISIAAHGTTSVGSASNWSAGSASTWTFEQKTIPNVTAAGSGSASLTFAMDTTDTKKLKITFSHTHTAPTLGTAITVQSKSGGGNGTAPSLTVTPTTVVNGTTHSITDNGHTHSIS